LIATLILTWGHDEQATNVRSAKCRLGSVGTPH